MDLIASFWELLSKNSFMGAFVSAIAIIFLGWLANLLVKDYQATRVYEILKTGLQEKNKTFLPATYLAAKAGYTKSQIETLCTYHKKIHRNEKELESWRIE